MQIFVNINIIQKNRFVNQPLTVKVRIGSRQKIGLKTKLSSRAEAFLRKIITTRTRGSEAKRSPSSFRAAISSDIMLAKLVGVNKPNTRPMPNKKIAAKIHLL